MSGSSTVEEEDMGAVAVPVLVAATSLIAVKETLSGRGKTWTGCAESLIRVVARREAQGCGGAGAGRGDCDGGDVSGSADSGTVATKSMSVPRVVVQSHE